MARISEIKPTEATGKVKAMFEGPLKEMHSNFFYPMMNSLPTVEFFLGSLQKLAQGSLTESDRQIVMLTVSEDNNCDYCISFHSMMCGIVGLAEEEILSIRKNAAKDKKKSSLIKFTKSILKSKGFVTNEDIAAFRSTGFSDSDIVEVIAVIGIATFSNYFNHVNESVNDLPRVPALN